MRKFAIVELFKDKQRFEAKAVFTEEEIKILLDALEDYGLHGLCLALSMKLKKVI